MSKLKIGVLIGKIFYHLNKIYNNFIHLYILNYYKTQIKKIGKCVRFNGISYISGFDNIEIGNNVHIGNNAWIKGEGGLYIGDNTHISRNLVLYTVSHQYEGDLLPYDENDRKRKVIIEKNVWIGMNVVILPGTIIREGAVIGAGAVVAGEVPKGAIYGANLGKIIKYRDLNHYEILDKNKRYGGINGKKVSDECKKA